MISAEEARNKAKEVSNFNEVLHGISEEIRKASEFGRFAVRVKVESTYKHTVIKTLEDYGYDVEIVTQGIYPTGEIDIRW